jgi:hypothetical protein
VARNGLLIKQMAQCNALEGVQLMSHLRDGMWHPVGNRGSGFLSASPLP